MSSPIVILCGATATGKSARALALAEERPAVIINADAMQVYRELRILTARPSEEDEARAPHALYGILPASEPCSAVRWLTLARQAIDQAHAERRTPLVTGGTGLYLKTLMEGLSPLPDIPPDARAEARRLIAEDGPEALFTRDPLMHARLPPGDTQRIMRALEVWLATGRSLAHWHTQPRIPPYPDAEFTVIYQSFPREELYKRCDARFLQMLEQGALEEARALHTLSLPRTLPALRAVGVPELLAHLDGTLSLAAAITHAQQMTRNYAKRQRTWFRKIKK